MKRFYYFFITVLFFTAANCNNSTVTPEAPVTIDSPVTQRIIDNTNLIAEVYDDTVFQVVPGVKETDIHYMNNQGYTMHVFILRVDLNNPKITLEAALSYNGTTFDRQTVPAMAEQAEAGGHHVIAAINGDFFTDTAPWGIVVNDGVVLKGSFSRPRSQTFLAILSDGDQPFIGDRTDLTTMEGELKDALGGTEMLVRDSEVVPTSIADIHPRTGAGVSDNGIVYFIVADGRDLGYSHGMTLYQLARMLEACGATKAMNLDGGGSSTFVIRNPQGDDIWQVRNRPSDGSPRAVSNAWLVITESLDE